MTATATSPEAITIPACFEVHNQEHLDGVCEFARKAGKVDSLTECFEQLERIANNRKSKVKLFSDFAPQSFYFEIYAAESPDKVLLNGGVIFHGAHDRGGDGGLPTLSVCLNPTDGWSIHT